MSVVNVWEKYNFLIQLVELFVKILPYKVRKYLFYKFRYTIGWFGLGMRYVLLKTLAKEVKNYVLIQPNVCIFNMEKLIIGSRVAMNENSYLECSGGIEIADSVLIGHGVSIISNSHNFDDVSKPISDQGYTYKKVVIKKNAWIGAKATILCGVTIGENAIVGANALENRDVADNEIVAGVPAKTVRFRDKRR